MNVAELMDFLRDMEKTDGNAKVVLGAHCADDIRLLESACEALYDAGDIGQFEDGFDGDPCLVLWFGER